MKKIVLSSLLAISALGSLLAQDAAATKDNRWKFKAGLGLDLAALLQLNPKQGAGDDRLGLGGNSNFEAKYTKDRLEWINSANLLLTVQKIGDITNFDQPFQKATDNLVLRSNVSYDTKVDSKWSYWFGTELSTQLTPTYTGNLLSDTTRAKVGAIAHFLAPGNFIAAPGLQYKPSKFVTIRLSPASLKLNIVADNRLAAIPNLAKNAGVFGNPWNSATDYQQVAYQLGGFLNVNYKQGFLPFKVGEKTLDRLVIGSNLNLYSNYLKDPQYVDVDWQNTVDFFIFKGLSLRYIGNVWYDHDYDVVLDKTTNRLGKGVSFTQQILVAFTMQF
jgi:hypothetical protein